MQPSVLWSNYECKVAMLLVLLDCSPCYKCFSVDVVFLVMGGGGLNVFSDLASFVGETAK